jgi:hypothetical protein
MIMPRLVAACVFVLWFGPDALGAERYALVVTGASGGKEYAEKYGRWRTSFLTILRERLGYPDEHVIALAEDHAGAGKATRENVRAAFDRLRQRAAKDDVVLVLLIGHGTTDGDEAKFNLVGPDLTASEWATLAGGIAGRLVFVNGSGGSFLFLERMAGPGRLVLTATDSAAQQFETIFPEFFINAFGDPLADLDKNARVSVWEAFRYSSDGVRAWFEEQGRLATERPMLDDTGDGVGRDAGTPGVDGAVAQATYLQIDAPIAAGAGDLAGLLRERGEIESALGALRSRKAALPPAQYETELEGLLLELARLDARIREKS